jgi:hypothetical protein
LELDNEEIAMASEKIHGQICEMLSEVEAIAKDRKNQQQGFNFRGIDDVYNTVHPVLAKCKVYPLCEIMEEDREERTSKHGSVQLWCRLRIKYHLVSGLDGSRVSTEVIGEAADTGDKSTNKALSIAYKYALFQLLCIPTEAIDPDATVVDAGPKKEAKPEQKAPAKPAAKPQAKTEPKPEYPTKEQVWSIASDGPVAKGDEIERIANRMRDAELLDAGLHSQVIYQVLSRRVEATEDFKILEQTQGRVEGYLKRGWINEEEAKDLTGQVVKRTQALTAKGASDAK